MRKKHAIDLNELFEYQQKEKMIYASCSNENKRLYITLRGSYEVWHKKQLVLETIQPFQAVEKYNSL